LQRGKLMQALPLHAFFSNTVLIHIDFGQVISRTGKRFLSMNRCALLNLQFQKFLMKK
jgi:hypothetical protein